MSAGGRPAINFCCSSFSATSASLVSASVASSSCLRCVICVSTHLSLCNGCDRTRSKCVSFFCSFCGELVERFVVHAAFRCHHNKMSNESSQFKVVNATQNVLLNVQRQLFHKLCKRIADDPRPCVHKWFEESVPALRVPRKNMLHVLPKPPDGVSL